ncbi:MAG: hypothetical protein QOF44_900 [Streptomyces sp.]|nr:hypothetical protein [Streptomyces sp.]
MIANPTAHRRANAFAEALEDDGPQAVGEQQHGAHAAHAADRHADPDQGRMLALADALEDVPRPTLDPAKKIEQRAQLIAAMEAALADGTLKVPEQRGSSSGSTRNGAHRYKPSSRWGRRLAAGGLSVGVAAGALGGVAAASTDALPGDTLYGLKRGMEDMRLDLADNDAARGKVYLDLASTRFQEARRLMERGRNGSLDDESVGEIGKALSGMQQEASEGHRLLSAAYRRDGSLQPIETLSAFSSSHRQGWTELRDRLPSRLTDVGNRVNSVFDAIEHEVGPLQKLLPPATGGTADNRNGAPSGTRSGTSGKPAPSVTGSATGKSAGSGKSSPSSGASSDNNLIGGLVDGGSTSTPSSSPSTSADSTQPSVTLPPLLPGLLPGLGLAAEDD